MILSQSLLYFQIIRDDEIFSISVEVEAQVN